MLSRRAQTYLAWISIEFLRLQEKFPALRDWTLKTTRSAGVVGLANYKHKTISLSAELLDLGSYKQIEETLLHEVAHALDDPARERGGPHGTRWKSYMKMLCCPCEEKCKFVGYSFLSDMSAESKEAARAFNRVL